MDKRNAAPASAQAGFSLAELLTALALMAVIAAGMVGVMNNLNAQAERMNTQTELLAAGKSGFALMRPWIERAGYRLGATALPSGKNYQKQSDQHIALCFDLNTATRRLIEFRHHNKKLQQRITDNNACIASGSWSDMSEPLFANIEFQSIANTSGAAMMVGIKLTLEKPVPGTAQTSRTTMHTHIPLYALASL